MLDRNCEKPNMYHSGDGSRATVIACATCGTKVSYTYQGCEEQEHDKGACDCYDAFVNWALEDAEEHDAS